MIWVEVFCPRPSQPPSPKLIAVKCVGVLRGVPIEAKKLRRTAVVAVSIWGAWELLMNATKDASTKASAGTPPAIADLMRPPVLCLGRSSPGLHSASQSQKSCRTTPPAWSARRNTCQSRSASLDIRYLPCLLIWHSNRYCTDDPVIVRSRPDRQCHDRRQLDVARRIFSPFTPHPRRGRMVFDYARWTWRRFTVGFRRLFPHRGVPRWNWTRASKPCGQRGKSDGR
jgi:hypothetical protein